MDALSPATLPIRNNRIRLTQGTLFWREVGYGETVLLLHGSWQDSAQWIPLMTALSPFVHCLAPDLLGFGESSPLPPSGAIDDQVAALSEYLEKVRAYPKVIVADSLGAWVALRYCLHRPGAIQRLVLLAPEGFLLREGDRSYQDWRWLARRWDPRAWGLVWFAPIVRLLKGDRWLTQARKMRAQFRRYPTTCHLLFQRRKPAIQSESLNDAVAGIQVSTFLLQPEALSRRQQAIIHGICQAMPKAQLVPLPGNEASVWLQGDEETQAVVWQSLQNVILSPYK